MRGGREADAQVGEDKEKGVRKKKKVNKVKGERRGVAGEGDGKGRGRSGRGELISQVSVSQSGFPRHQSSPRAP